MKVIIRTNGFLLSGKAWEIRAKLNEYSKQFQYVEEWIKGSKSDNQ
ncbi:MAG: Z-ring formation inhibitor MciZ [Bacillota bacterium]